MVSISITREHLVIRILGWHKLHAMRSSLSIPWVHVTGVRVRPAEARYDDVIVESWRGVGTYIPGKMVAGTSYCAGGRIFFDVCNPEKTIAIDVAGMGVKHIVVELAGESPEHALVRIETGMGLRRQKGAQRVEELPQDANSTPGVALEPSCVPGDGLLVR